MRLSAFQQLLGIGADGFSVKLDGFIELLGRAGGKDDCEVGGLLFFTGHRDAPKRGKRGREHMIAVLCWYVNTLRVFCCEMLADMVGWSDVCCITQAVSRQCLHGKEEDQARDENS
jgi:hypothetical protein